MELPTEVSELDAHMKPNLRHNIRKSKNRLGRAGINWRVEVADAPGPELQAAMASLTDLHSTRARQDRGMRHQDYLSDPQQAEFLRAVAPRMAAAGYLSVWSLIADSRPVASLLVLRADEELFFSVSGMDPTFWNFRPMTLLREACIRAAIPTGARRVNFLVGPNAGKLDWAETIEVHHHFSVISGRRRARALHGGYLLYRTLREYRSAAASRL
jgi:CelD/BcsL family acetyltransferase involved in cellulose biosynthesis